MAGSNYVCKPKDKIDTVDLKIIRCLSRDCRASYRDISSIVGITPNAIKERINTMVCNDIIQSFILNVNPVLFGYEKETSLSTKTVTRRLEKLRENHIVEFGVIRNMSSMQLAGYIEFAVVIHLEDDSLFYQPVLERIYQEMQEYLFVIPYANQKEGIF